SVFSAPQPILAVMANPGSFRLTSRRNPASFRITACSPQSANSDSCCSSRWRSGGLGMMLAASCTFFPKPLASSIHSPNCSRSNLPRAPPRVHACLKRLLGRLQIAGRSQQHCTPLGHVDAAAFRGGKWTGLQSSMTRDCTFHTQVGLNRFPQSVSNVTPRGDGKHCPQVYEEVTLCTF